MMKISVTFKKEEKNQLLMEIAKTQDLKEKKQRNLFIFSLLIFNL